MRSADAPLPVIVLAAGRGRRMGGPKALMQVAGQPWWARQLESLVAAGAAPVWVVSPVVRAAMEKDPRSLKQALVDGDADAPMFESVRAGLRFLQPVAPRGVYVLPIDVPAPAREAWKALASAGPVAVPTWHGEHGHPVYLEWSFVKAHADAPAGARLDELIARLVRYVVVDDASVSKNLNTPAALSAYERELPNPARVM